MSSNPGIEKNAAINEPLLEGGKKEGFSSNYDYKVDKKLSVQKFVRLKDAQRESQECAMHSLWLPRVAEFCK